MLKLNEEQLSMISGGEIALGSTADSDGISRDDLVVWKGHEDMGTGIVDLYIFGKYVVTFEKKTFPWMIIKSIDGSELKVVGHYDRPMPPWI